MQINTKKLSTLFKTNKTEIQKFCSTQLRQKIEYQYLSIEERDLIVIKILERINEDKQIIASKGRKEKWLKGWEESLKTYSKNKSLKSLVPKFYTARENKFFRLGGEFIKVKNPMFEVNMINIYRNWYFKKYFSKVKNIYEFGAGTGINLIELSKIFPKKKIYGSDFVKSAVDLLKLVSKNNDLNLNAFKFDMSKPNLKYKILKNSGVYTSGAIEQLGGSIHGFMNYILSQKPTIVIHSEPVSDFYNTSKLPDFLGNLFQNKRGYKKNLLSYLKIKKKKKKIKILKLCKSPFGSLMMEGHNLIVWKPYLR